MRKHGELSPLCTLVLDLLCKLQLYPGRKREREGEGGREEGGDEQSTVERRKEEKQRIHFLCVYVRIQSHHCCLSPHEPFHHLHPHRVCRIWGKRLGKHYANHRLEATGAATAQSPTPDLSPRRNLEIKD